MIADDDGFIKQAAIKFDAAAVGRGASFADAWSVC
jgi:hypothetical protein